MTRHKRYLVIRADGACRVLTHLDRGLAADETAIQLNIDMPDGWGRIAQVVNITVPEVGIPAVSV